MESHKKDKVFDMILGNKIFKILDHLNIKYTTQHHHCTRGWVNIHCPFCPGRQNFHLGIHIQTGRCHCWRCGGKDLIKTLSRASGAPLGEIFRLLEETSSGLFDFIGERKFHSEPEKKVPFKLPDHTPLTKVHADYLKSRGFDVEELVELWDVSSTLHIGNYRHRILIPIKYNGEVVSFQTRSISKRKEVVRYKSCPRNMEIISHKVILYGYDYIPFNKTCVVVEGVTDVWKLGPGAVATFGITFTFYQVLLLASMKRVYLMFDNERVASRQVDRLSSLITSISDCEVFQITDYGYDDPGSMPLDEAHALCQELIFKE